MGSPKGKKHRIFTPEEKLCLVEKYYSSHVSQMQFAKQEAITYSCLCRWIKDYAEKGKEGLASHRDGCGNRYSALHTSKTLDEIGQLQLQVAMLEADVARLKKGYLVKGSGSSKEYVTGSGKTFKSSGNSKNIIP